MARRPLKMDLSYTQSGYTYGQWVRWQGRPAQVYNDYGPDLGLNLVVEEADGCGHICVPHNHPDFDPTPLAQPDSLAGAGYRRRRLLIR